MKKSRKLRLGKLQWWQSTCIIHCGYRVEYEVEDDWDTGVSHYTGRSRYVLA